MKPPSSLATFLLTSKKKKYAHISPQSERSSTWESSKTSTPFKASALATSDSQTNKVIHLFMQICSKLSRLWMDPLWEKDLWESSELLKSLDWRRSSTKSAKRSWIRRDIRLLKAVLLARSPMFRMTGLRNSAKMLGNSTSREKWLKNDSIS